MQQSCLFVCDKVARLASGFLEAKGRRESHFQTKETRIFFTVSKYLSYCQPAVRPCVFLWHVKDHIDGLF